MKSDPKYVNTSYLYLYTRRHINNFNPNACWIQNTGLVLQAAKRIQVNVDLKPSNSIDLFKRVPAMIFPIMWAEEYASVDDENINTLKNRLLTPLKVIDIGKWTGLAISCILIGSGAGIFYLRSRRKRVYM